MLRLDSAWWVCFRDDLRHRITTWPVTRTLRLACSHSDTHHHGPDSAPVVRIPLYRLRIDHRIRRSGENIRHVNTLSDVAALLPPIVVHRSNMTVIDGAHRVRAAHHTGAQWIDAVYFDGDEAQAFLLAVRLNNTHGLPLSAADRMAAAEQALTFYPDWTDYQLAQAIGLSERAIALIRKRALTLAAQSR